MITSLTQIETAAKNYAQARDLVSNSITVMNDEIEAVKRRHMAKLKARIIHAAGHHSDLKNLIESAPALFLKPRTYIFHGIKVGFTKQKGQIEILDEAKTITLIRKHLPNLEDALIQTTETVAKKALSTLSGDDLKKIGCGITNDTDHVVIKPTDSEVEKAVAALLKDATEDLQQAAA
jgi:hypothetical protein